MTAEQKNPKIVNIAGSSLTRVTELQTDYYRSQRTREYGFRMEQLRRLRSAVERFENHILSALKQDLDKSERESKMSELSLIYHEIRFFQKNLKSLMATKTVPTPIFLAPSKSSIEAVPLGRVLIIAPWNYPFLLTLVPLIGAIAAGNCVVMKPSEIASHSSQIIAEIIGDVFAEEFVSCFEGGVEVSQELLKQPWDHVFFTGSTRVGKIVAACCAETLTPFTLELGGKSPTIVTQHANIPIAARRIIFGKITNAGQTCVAPDYILVQSSFKDQLIAALIDEIKRQLGSNILVNPSYGRIINSYHFKRLKGLLKQGKIIYGGETAAKERFVSITLMEDIDPSSDLAQEEVFGPLLPILTYEKFEDIANIIEKHPKPLAAYLFSEDKSEIERFKKSIAFGGGCINDTLIHVSNSYISFGGVGASGIGSYHGQYSFDTFSHYKSIMQSSTAIDPAVRYLPDTKLKNKVLKIFLGG